MLVLTSVGLSAPAAAMQQPAAPAALTQTIAQVVSSEFSMSGSEAALDLELAGDRSLEIAIRDGGVFIDGVRVGDAARGSELDRAWRDLLTGVMGAPAADLPQLLHDWHAEGEPGTQMDRAIESALTGSGSAFQGTAAAPAVPTPDVDRLLDSIAELEQTIVRLEGYRERVVTERTVRRRAPFRYIAEGIAGIFSMLVTYVVLFAIGFGVIFFGGRSYIEGVADTARHSTGRSFLVGVAACFLVVPAFVIGIIALIISIIGIPGLLVWVPAFPLAVVLSLILGYLGIAHAAGEAFAERRYYASDWFQRGNSYYFLLSGLGLLLALFLTAQVVHMAGSWLQAIKGVLIFLGVVSTGVAITIGFGAVLLSRAGTQPVRDGGTSQEQDLFSEDADV
ncbi:MAG: hypothetical protein WEF86_07195 [Gemmatimonadota bacterium]